MFAIAECKVYIELTKKTVLSDIAFTMAIAMSSLNSKVKTLMMAR